ncbi:hypothetical protein BCR39DRAFT_230785 [Naematelia encephala]|uniref:Uncharacterized protein n=1 Tax=Naematelia encephala TaxID=71784 RepID=A0A1Y2BGM1_9TREE|nr:hypothetical protein BCR39DRAFT_230785 [Naematelia encephala]
MATTFEVVPGKSVGDFQLGDSLWHVLDLLRTQKTRYPKIEVSWDPDNAHKSAVTIHLQNITLVFPPSPHQTLQVISLPNLASTVLPVGLTLAYENDTLLSPSRPLTRARVGKILGPTYAHNGSSKLVYPGISFDISGAASGSGGAREDLVTSLTVVPREEGDIPVLNTIKGCIIQPNVGVTLFVPDELEIKINETTSQDLLLDLGPPLRKYWKEDERLERMWGAGDAEKGSCFWNYFQYGLDFLISPSGFVTKVIAHSNIPGTPLFQRYARCPWTLPTSSNNLDFSSPLSSFRAHLASKSQAQYVDEVRLTVPTIASNGHGKKKSKRVGSPSSGRSGSGGSDVSPEHGAGDGFEAVDAMVLDRVVEGGLDGVIGVGTSRLVGFDGLIVEEDQQSGGICSILVWRDDNAL